MVEKIIFNLQESYRNIRFLPGKTGLYFLALIGNHFFFSSFYILYLNYYYQSVKALPSIFVLPESNVLTLLLIVFTGSFFFANNKFIKAYLKLNYNEIKLIKKLNVNPSFVRNPIIFTSFSINLCSLLTTINIIKIFYNNIYNSGITLLHFENFVISLFIILFIISTIILLGTVYYLFRKEISYFKRL